MGRISIKNLLCGSGLALIGAVTPAHAQSSSTEADIVVTARRVEERLQDVPISITVFNQEQLANANVVNASDLASITPSLATNNNFGSENSSFAIRGFVQDIGTAPSVGVYFADVVALRGASNGLVTGDGAGPGAFFDLQNVQVLKGPQGTLFGRNTTGGAVLLVPQRPTDEFGGYLEVSGGNFDMQRYQGVVNVPLSDTARLRVGIDRMTRDGYLNNTSGIGPEDFADVDYTAARVSFVADLTPSLENYTVATYTNSDTHGSFQKLIAASMASPDYSLGGFGLGQVATQGSGFYDLQQDLPNPQSALHSWQLINTTTWDISDSLTFKNIISYGELTNDFDNPIFGTNFSIGPDHLQFASSRPRGHTADQSTFTEEARLEGSSFDNRLTWQAGAYLEVSNPLSQVGSNSPVFASCSNPADVSTCTSPAGPGFGSVNFTYGETKFQSNGIYTQASYALTDHLELTAGYRYTWDRQSNQSVQYGQRIGVPAPPSCTLTGAFTLDPETDCFSHRRTASEAPTWLLGLDYTPTEDLLLYAKYARGYRTGVISTNVPGPFDIVDPEQVEAYEIGSKWSFGGDLRGILNTAIFYNDFSNQQVQLGFNTDTAVTGVSPTAAPVNIGASEIYGAEIEASITPFTGFTLSVGYTYLHTEIIEADIPTGTFGPYDLTGAMLPGDPLPLSPENKYTISARYLLPLSESVGEITLGATFIHTDEQLTNYIDREEVGTVFEDLSYVQATDLINVNVSWDRMFGAPVDLLIFGTNVTDEEYYTFIPGIASHTGLETAALGQPRMYGASLRYHF